MTHLVAVASLTLCLLASSLPAAAAPSDEALRAEIERLREERRHLQAEEDNLEREQQQLSTELEDVTQRVEALTSELAQLHDRADAMRKKLGGLEAEAAEDRDRLGDRLSALYKGAAASDVVGLLAGESPTALTERGHYLSLLAGKDREGLEALAASTVALNRQREELAETTARIHQVAEETKAAQAELDQRLTAAHEKADETRRAIAQRESGIAEREAELARREEERRRKAAERRRREAETRRLAAAKERRRVAASRARAASAREEPQETQGSAPVSGGLSCPQGHPRSFVDTWGAPRSGGRRHQGTDVFGARGGDVFAIVDGVVTTTKTGKRAGLMLVLRGDNGDTYWYLHLQDFVASPGQRVRAGQLIGHNGDTGNARGTTPHIHFERHPGGGGAVNPYPLLRRACG